MVAFPFALCWFFRACFCTQPHHDQLFQCPAEVPARHPLRRESAGGDERSHETPALVEGHLVEFGKKEEEEEQEEHEKGSWELRRF